MCRVQDVPTITPIPEHPFYSSKSSGPGRKDQGEGKQLDLPPPGKNTLASENAEVV